MAFHQPVPTAVIDRHIIDRFFRLDCICKALQYAGILVVNSGFLLIGGVFYQRQGIPQELILKKPVLPFNQQIGDKQCRRNRQENHDSVKFCGNCNPFEHAAIPCAAFPRATMQKFIY